MASGDAVEVEGEKKAVTPDQSPSPSPSRGDEDEGRGTKRGSPEKGGGGGEEGGEKRARRRKVDATPVERPSRERKAVERYSALSPRKVSATKALSIEQGSGTKLKDIPNVVFKLSKRKIDDNLQALHTVLFGRKSNVHSLKRNIFQFSGFVWSDNEEKLRAKFKEKLDKFTKDKLVDFCELLDIHIVKATTKKEEISAKLLEFLESPHVTRDVSLADKDKKRKKRSRKTKGVRQAVSGEASSDKVTKKHKKGPETEVKKRSKQSAEPEEEHNDEDDGGSTSTKDASTPEEDNGNSVEESEHASSEEDDEGESEEPVVKKKESDEDHGEKDALPKDKEKTSRLKSDSPAKSDKSPLKPVSKNVSLSEEHEEQVDVDGKDAFSKEQKRKGSKAVTKENDAPVKKADKKKSSRKKDHVDGSDSSPPSASKSKNEIKKKRLNNDKPVPEDKKASKKEAKAGSKVSNKGKGKGKADAGPSTNELHSVVSSILKEVDFNTATLADILRQLGTHFNTDLMDRKAEVRRIIEDVINNMTDDEDGDDDEDDAGDAGEDKGESNTKEEESDDGGKK